MITSVVPSTKCEDLGYLLSVNSFRLYVVNQLYFMLSGNFSFFPVLFPLFSCSSSSSLSLHSFILPLCPVSLLSFFIAYIFFYQYHLIVCLWINQAPANYQCLFLLYLISLLFEDNLIQIFQNPSLKSEKVSIQPNIWSLDEAQFILFTCNPYSGDSVSDVSHIWLSLFTKESRLQYSFSSPIFPTWAFGDILVFRKDIYIYIYIYI